MVTLGSFAPALNVVVVGATGGIGGALVEALASSVQVQQLFALSRTGSGRPQPAGAASADAANRIYPVTLDLERPETIEQAAETVRANAVGPLDLVLVTTGLLHDGRALRPEKSLKALDAEALARSFAVNTIGPGLVAKAFLPLLRRDTKSAFAALSARVGSIEDNRLGGWYGYRASKAALNMLLRTTAIELARTHPLAVCVGLHPGTVATRLSAPFQSAVPEGKLFTPAVAAAHLIQVVDGLTAVDSGGLFAWDGQRIPF